MKGILTRSEAKAFEAFKRDIEWFESNREQLAATYKDEYVAVKGKKILDHDADFPKLVMRLREKGERTEYTAIEFTGEEKLLLQQQKMLAHTRRGSEFVVSTQRMSGSVEKVVSLIPVGDLLAALERQGESELKDMVKAQ